MKARVPDLDMTSSVVKGVKLVRNLAMGDSGEMLIVYRPHSRSQPITIYGWHAATQKYVWWQNIDYDEKIVDNFELARFVSGALKAVSATVSGGNFNVSGVISATQYQDLPDVEALRFETISSYKRDNLNTLSCVVTEGVCSLAHPDGAHNFVPYNTTSVTSQDALLVINDEINLASDSPLWQDGAAVFDTTRITGYLPSNLSGLITVHGNICIASNSFVTLTVSVNGSQISPDFLTVTPIFNATDCAYDNSAFGRSMSVFLSAYYPWPVESITITSSDASSVLGSSMLSIICQDYYQRGFRGPGTLIGMQAVTPGQQISLNAVGNFEVVPNASLSRNLSTNYAHMENPFDMEMAEMYIQKMPFLGESMLQTIPVYDMLLARKYYHHLSDRGVLGEASSFTDFLRNLWSKARPMLGAIAPVAGAAFGPEGALIGRGLGGLLGSASSVYQKPGHASFIGSGEYNKQVSETTKRIRYLEKELPNYLDLSNFNLTSGDNMTLLKLSTKAGILENTAIGVALFPYVVQNRVFYGRIYTAGSPVGIGANPKFAVTSYDDLTTLVSSRHEIDNEALCSVLLGVQAAAFSGVNFVAVDTDHPIVGGSLGAAAYYSATKTYLGAPVSGSITPEGCYFPDDIEIKAKATNEKLRRPLLVAGVPVDPIHIHTAEALARGKIVGNEIPKIIPLKNATCGNLYACLFSGKPPGTNVNLRTDQVTVDTKSGPEQRTRIQLHTAKVPASQQATTNTYPITVEYYDPTKGKVTKQIRKEREFGTSALYNSIQNSAAFKKGADPNFGIQSTEMTTIKKHINTLKSDPNNKKAIGSLLGMIRGALTKNLSIIAAKERLAERSKKAPAQTKRQNLPLIQKSSLLDLSELTFDDGDLEDTMEEPSIEGFGFEDQLSDAQESSLGNIDEIGDIMASLSQFL